MKSAHGGIVKKPTNDPKTNQKRDKKAIFDLLYCNMCSKRAYFAVFTRSEFGIDFA